MKRQYNGQKKKDNTMDKRMRTQGQTMIYKTLHRKLKSKQNEHIRNVVNDSLKRTRRRNCDYYKRNKSLVSYDKYSEAINQVMITTVKFKLQLYH